jgi:hypothetical protein
MSAEKEDIAPARDLTGQAVGEGKRTDARDTRVPEAADLLAQAAKSALFASKKAK